MFPDGLLEKFGVSVTVGTPQSAVYNDHDELDYDNMTYDTTDTTAYLMDDGGPALQPQEAGYTDEQQLMGYIKDDVSLSCDPVLHSIIKINAGKRANQQFRVVKQKTMPFGSALQIILEPTRNVTIL